MSKYADNPWWCQEHDAPIMIMSRSDWYRATAGGHLTMEHVMLRLRNLGNHVFGEQGAAAFDENGFVTSLTSAGLTLAGDVRLRVYPNDHSPPHVHIEVPSHPKAKIRLSLATGAFLDDPPRGIPSKKLKRFQAAVRENHDVLAAWWERYHGEPVVLTTIGGMPCSTQPSGSDIA